ncbi:hypothetical protein R50073_14320 [Maricurvus nonylphenolicus]
MILIAIAKFIGRFAKFTNFIIVDRIMREKPYKGEVITALGVISTPYCSVLAILGGQPRIGGQ